MRCELYIQNRILMKKLKYIDETRQTWDYLKQFKHETISKTGINKVCSYLYVIQLQTEANNGNPLEKKCHRKVGKYYGNRNLNIFNGYLISKHVHINIFIQKLYKSINYIGGCSMGILISILIWLRLNNS